MHYSPYSFNRILFQSFNVFTSSPTFSPFVCAVPIYSAACKSSTRGVHVTRLFEEDLLTLLEPFAYFPRATLAPRMDGVRLSRARFGPSSKESRLYKAFKAWLKDI